MKMRKTDAVEVWGWGPKIHFPILTGKQSVEIATIQLHHVSEGKGAAWFPLKTATSTPEAV